MRSGVRNDLGLGGSEQPAKEISFDDGMVMKRLLLVADGVFDGLLGGTHKMTFDYPRSSSHRHQEPTIRYTESNCWFNELFKLIDSPGVFRDPAVRSLCIGSCHSSHPLLNPPNLLGILPSHEPRARVGRVLEDRRLARCVASIDAPIKKKISYHTRLLAITRKVA